MLIYLATPYSRYSGGTDEAYYCACLHASTLLSLGFDVFCPIAHTHGMDRFVTPDCRHTFWMRADRVFMELADVLFVSEMGGWRESRGISEEIEFFRQAGKPVFYAPFNGVPAEIVPPVERRIIGLTGYARSGKDTVAGLLGESGWQRFAFADAAKGAALAVNPVIQAADTPLAELVGRVGWEGAKRFTEVRGWLQRTGTEAGREVHGRDCWIRIVSRKVGLAGDRVVITDVRFEDEADWIRRQGGVIVRVSRPGVGPANEHSSEALAFEPDLLIENDGSLDDLREEAMALEERLFENAA